MADLSSFVQRPNASTVVIPTYTAVTAADKFLASQNSGYMLHYKNGATLAGAVYINEKLAANPPSSQAPIPPPAGGLKWSDFVVHTAFPASVERVVFIDNISAYIDNLGFVNLQHLGTITTLTVCIMGPL
jgi:hypothetical protein